MNWNGLLLVLILFSFGCTLPWANTGSRVYKPQEISKIRTWTINFEYVRAKTQKKEANDGTSEGKITRYGEHPRDLQLIDDLVFYLRGDHKIMVGKKQNDNAGAIKIHPLNYYWKEGTYFKSLSVLLYNSVGELLAQIKIKNGNRTISILEEDEFAEYAAKQLAVILKK